MIHHYTSNLLRRTFIAVAAVALAVPFQGFAAQVMKGTSGSTTTTALCDSYGSLSVSPNGTLVVVDCVASGGGGQPPVQQPGGAGTIAVAATGNNATLQSGWNNLVWFARNGGSSGAVHVTLSVSPTSTCQLGSGFIDWGDGDAGTHAVGLNAMAGATSCTVSVTSVTGATQDSAASSFTMSTSGSGGTGTTGTGGGGTQAANCTSALASNVLSNYSFGFGVNTLMTMPSGTVAYAPLVSSRAASNGTYSGGEVIFESTSTAPIDGDMEISINHCKGSIDTNGGACYSKYTIPNAVNWTEQPGAVNTPTTCGADPNNGPWYINVRFNYSRCAWGTCGYVGQLLYR